MAKRKKRKTKRQRLENLTLDDRQREVFRGLPYGKHSACIFCKRMRNEDGSPIYVRGRLPESCLCWLCFKARKFKAPRRAPQKTSGYSWPEGHPALYYGPIWAQENGIEIPQDVGEELEQLRLAA